MYCDNEASVTVMSTGRVKDSFMQACLRELEWVAAKCEFEIKGRHIEGVTNRVPDALSRWSMGKAYREQFETLVKGRKVTEVFVYEGLFNFQHNW